MESCFVRMEGVLQKRSVNIRKFTFMCPSVSRAFSAFWVQGCGARLIPRKHFCGKLAIFAGYYKWKCRRGVTDCTLDIKMKTEILTRILMKCQRPARKFRQINGIFHSSQLFCKFSVKPYQCRKVLDTNRDHTKKFREINSLVTSLVKTLISRKKC